MNFNLPDVEVRHVEANHEAISTLDEPVLQTLLRDVKAVWRKMLIVVWPPLGKEGELQDWDLWGPLALCLILASILAATASENQASLIFSAVFLLIWFGAAVIALNAKFLGCNISFFQTICVIGYSTAPLCVAAIFALFTPTWLNVIISLATWAWACWASLRFFRGTAPADREMLVLYPVALMYFFVAWMIIVGV